MIFTIIRYLRWGFDSADHFSVCFLRLSLNFDPFSPTVPTMVTTDIGIWSETIGTLVRIGWLCRHIDWHWSPESSQLNWSDTTVDTDGNLGTKKMGLVGEFKFFSEFSWAETGATDWKQTKAGNCSHQQNLFQTDSSVFFSQKSAQ